MQTISADNPGDAAKAIRQSRGILPMGNGTKNLLSNAEDCTQLVLSGLNGILEYEPTEFTFTAFAGTPLSVINAALRENQQELPFDPPLVESGATLGGAVASGLNGSSSLRFGGARDFILGVRFLDGQGESVFAGGKVVKNAAGFDLPKFFVGSCGRFGVMTEITMKVFPCPPAFCTLVFEDSLATRIALTKKLAGCPMEISGVDLFQEQLLVRIGGTRESIESSSRRILELLHSEARVLWGEQDHSCWSRFAQFNWADRRIVLKVPCQIDQVANLWEVAKSNGALIHTALAGQVSHIACEPQAIGELVKSLDRFKLRCQPFISRQPVPQEIFLTPFPPSDFSRRVQSALDPDARFLQIPTAGSA